MIALKRNIIYFILIISPLLFIASIYGANEEMLKVKSFNISGSTIEIISMVFDDYCKNQEGYRKEIEYYIFEINKLDNGYLKVWLNVDIKRVFEDFHVLSKGGGTKYMIDPDSKEIVSKVSDK